MLRIPHIGKLRVQRVDDRHATTSDAEESANDGKIDPYIPSVGEAVSQGRHSNVGLEVDASTLDFPKHGGKIQELTIPRRRKSRRVGGLLWYRLLKQQSGLECRVSNIIQIGAV